MVQIGTLCKYIIFSLDPQCLSLANLETLQCHIKEKIKIIRQCSAYYTRIGHDLLNDKNGSIVRGLELNFRDPERILQAIFSQWMQEDVDHSWKKLTECLRRCDLNTIASDIEDALGLQIQSNEGIFTLLVCT